MCGSHSGERQGSIIYFVAYDCLIMLIVYKVSKKLFCATLEAIPSIGCING